jgi:16S rRNA (cytosine967-C5)-methyltransferase
VISPARQAAYQVLRAVATGRQDLPAALARSRTRLTDPRDTALVAEIATGTLRWRGALDHLIAWAARRPLDRLDAEVLDILRLSLYQLLHLDRVPAPAVVDEAVQLTRRSGKQSAASLVNAVLRGLIRARQALPLPPRPSLTGDQPAPGTPEEAAALDYLSITQSHPRWLAARWLSRLGFAAAEQWVRFNNTPAPMTLRVNTLVTSAAALTRELAEAGVEVRDSSWAPDALVVEHGNPLRATSVPSDRYLVQSEASQLVGLFTGAAAGERVLDACAAPGGKTIVIANLMRNTGLLIASDRRERRVALLRTTLRQAGVAAHLVTLDMLAPVPFDPSRARFDRFLLDVPCTGLGTLRRDPDIRWRRTEQDVRESAARQRAMLHHAAEAVRPGGLLIYATCSSEPEENDEVIEAFLDEHPEFALEDARLDPVPPDGCRRALDARGCLRTSPSMHQLEAFFAARLRRRL